MCLEYTLFCYLIPFTFKFIPFKGAVDNTVIVSSEPGLWFLHKIGQNNQPSAVTRTAKIMSKRVSQIKSNYFL